MTITLSRHKFSLELKRSMEKINRADLKADYYFGPEKKILERAEEENEFEGSVVTQGDMEIIAKINEAVKTTFWRDIWTQLAFSGSKFEIEERIDDYENKHIYMNLYQIPTTALKEYNYSFNLIWSEDTQGANKKGWDWSGDTTVYVHELSGPPSIKEVCKQKSNAKSVHLLIDFA